MLVGITGHRPDAFKDDTAVTAVKASIALIHNYLKKLDANLEFNLGGAQGVDSWVAEFLIDNNIKFNLYLPFMVEVHTKFFSNEEKMSLDKQLKNAKTISIIGDRYNVVNYHVRNHQIVNNSDILICFWDGTKSGGTYSTIKYASEKNKKILNALQGMKEIQV